METTIQALEKLVGATIERVLEQYPNTDSEFLESVVITALSFMRPRIAALLTEKEQEIQELQEWIVRLIKHFSTPKSETK